MAHYYTVDLTKYCRPTSLTRSNVFEDSDLVAGNVEIYLQWSGGPMEPYLGGGPRSIVDQSNWGVGNATGTSWWEPQGTWNVDADGVLSCTSASKGLSFKDTSDFVDRGAAWDMTFRIKPVTSGMRVLMSNFRFTFSPSSGMIAEQFVSGYQTRFTGGTVLQTNTWYDVRIQGVSGGLWSATVNGVAQGSYTDVNAATTRRFSFSSMDADSQISAPKLAPQGSCPATTYEVINDDGDIVASGAVSGYKITIPDSSLLQGNGLGPYGGYKVRLYGANDDANYGTSKGDCQFVRVAAQSGFAAKPVAFTSSNQFGQIGWDIGLRCFFGMGCTRLTIADGPTAAAQYLQDNYVALAYPARPRHIIGHFNEDDPDGAAYFTSTVAALKDIIDAWEPLNEPMFSNYNGTNWAPKQQIFYNAVKAADPDAIVLGPNAVSYNITWDGWQNEFYTAGGGSYVDQVSDHAYGCSNGDISMARRLLDAHLVRTGRVGKIQWQTEQSQLAQFGDELAQRMGLKWNAVQLMVQETRGLPLERNVLWYDYQYGFQTYIWQTSQGGCSSLPVIMRTMMAEFGNRTFDSEYDLGSVADFYIAGKWVGADGTATVGLLAQSVGQPPLRFYLTGATSLTCVDAWGNEFTVARGASNVVSFDVDDLPTWVRLPVGVSLTVVPEWVFGTNVALNGTVSTTASPVYNLQSLTNGTLENQYDRTSGAPSNATGHNFSTWDGSQANPYPQTVTVALTAAADATRLVLSVPPPAQTWFSAPTDFDIDVSADGSTWTTVHTQTPAAVKSTAFVSDRNSNNTKWDTWFDPQTVWVVDLPGTTVSHVRFVVRAVSFGQCETQADSIGLGWGSGSPMTLREVRMYEGEAFDPTERQRFNLTVTCSG